MDWVQSKGIFRCDSISVIHSVSKSSITQNSHHLIHLSLFKVPHRIILQPSSCQQSYHSQNISIIITKFHFTPCQRNLSEKLEDYASYLLIGEEETFDSNWIIEDNEWGFHISLHYKGDRLNKHSARLRPEVTWSMAKWNCRHGHGHGGHTGYHVHEQG